MRYPYLPNYCPACEAAHEGEPCPPIPRCDLCNRACKPYLLHAYRSRPFDPKLQAVISLCPDCWQENG